jgi:polysaccharide biosynthesis/export protein
MLSQRIDGFPLRVRHVAGALLVSLAVSGCAALPGSGPTKSEIIGNQTQQTHEYTVINVDQSAVDTLMSRKRTSFFGTFGDQRPAPDQRIGTGDSLSVTIWEAAPGGLFSSAAIDGIGAGSRSATIPPQIVARDGAITVPYAGRVKVSGLRPHDVERAIVSRLEGKAIEPQALVSITRNESNTVTVSGEASGSAVVPLNVRGQRLMDVIAIAGGVNGAAHETMVSLSRNSRAVEVSLQRIMTDPSENIFVRPDDTINLFKAPLTFTAVGATGQNGVVPFGQVELTLEQAIAKAGGLLDARSDPEGVFILRFEPVDLARDLLKDSSAFAGETGHKPIVYSVNLRDAKSMFLARRFQIQDKDILYVANAPLNEVQKVFALVGALTSPVNTVQAIAN